MYDRGRAGMHDQCVETKEAAQRPEAQNSRNDEVEQRLEHDEGFDEDQLEADGLELEAESIRIDEVQHQRKHIEGVDENHSEDDGQRFEAERVRGRRLISCLRGVVDTARAGIDNGRCERDAKPTPCKQLAKR